MWVIYIMLLRLEKVPPVNILHEGMGAVRKDETKRKYEVFWAMDL
jgi:hypothetical protein